MYHTNARGGLFALLGRPRRDTSTTWVDEVSNPLPLTVALLYARHRASGGGGLTPAELLRDLGALWQGDARDLPPSISYLRAFPALFVTEYGVRPNSRPVGLHPQCIRLSPKALALAGAGVSAAGSAASSPAPPQPPSPAAARALLAATPLHWLPALTSTPCPLTWGPAIEGLLEEQGQGPSRRLPLHALLASIQALALERGLPLPPSSAHWFVLSPHPSYARLRPLWGEQVQPPADLTAPRANSGVAAVELVAQGSTALQEDLEALAVLAQQCRARRAQGSWGGAGPASHVSGTK